MLVTCRPYKSFITLYGFGDSNWIALSGFTLHYGQCLCDREGVEGTLGASSLTQRAGHMHEAGYKH